MKEHLYYILLLISFLIIHLAVSITISYIFYDFLLIFFLFYFVVKERAPEHKFKNRTQQKFLIKQGRAMWSEENGK